MSNTPLQPKFDLESLSQLPKDELVSIIVQQQRVIEQFKQEIEQFKQEIERLKAQQNTDSQTSSSPPSTDLLKKPEKPKALTETTESGKRKPGGQPGHPGKTRKGNGLVDRYEILRPQACPNCGTQEFAAEPVAVQMQQVAQLVERPIEIVEYQRHSCQCVRCGQVHTAGWPDSIVPGQDLGLSLQAWLVWLGNYGHLSYEQTSRAIAGNGRH